MSQTFPHEDETMQALNVFLSTGTKLEHHVGSETKYLEYIRSRFPRESIIASIPNHEISEVVRSEWENDFCQSTEIRCEEKVEKIRHNQDQIETTLISNGILSGGGIGGGPVTVKVVNPPLF